MPFVRLTTSAVIEDRADLMRSMSATIARLLAKPEAYVMVAVDEAAMLMSGSEDPAAFIDVRALGTMSPEITAALSRELSDIADRCLAIPAQRVFLNFATLERSMWGHGGKTFA
jgi:phenylpyruvate tautomerase PptA (4-oxalocrotonate tautomerase family)